jgi:hypothetical protein
MVGRRQMPEDDVTYAFGSYRPETVEADSPEEAEVEDKS